MLSIIILAMIIILPVIVCALQIAADRLANRELAEWIEANRWKQAAFVARMRK